MTMLLCYSIGFSGEVCYSNGKMLVNGCKQHFNLYVKCISLILLDKLCDYFIKIVIGHRTGRNL